MVVGVVLLVSIRICRHVNALGCTFGSGGFWFQLLDLGFGRRSIFVSIVNQEKIPLTTQQLRLGKGVDFLQLRWINGYEVEAEPRGANGSGGDDGGKIVVEVVILNAHGHEVSRVTFDGIANSFPLDKFDVVRVDFRIGRIIIDGIIIIELGASDVNVEIDDMRRRNETHFPFEKLEKHQLHLQEVGSGIGAGAVLTQHILFRDILLFFLELRSDAETAHRHQIQLISGNVKIVHEKVEKIDGEMETGEA